MLLSKEDRGSAMVLTVNRARIDAASAQQLAEEARQAIAKRSDDCVINLGSVTFLDSIGIGMLVNLLKSMGPSRRLTLAAMQPAVKRTLKMTRLDTVFATSDSVLGALNVAGQGQDLVCSPARRQLAP